MGLFIDLILDRTQIKSQITQYCEDEQFVNYSVSEILHLNGTQHRCSIRTDDKAIILDFYYKNNGKTTIKTTVGVEQEESFKVALYLKTNMCNNNIQNSSYSIKNVDSDIKDLLIEFLTQLKDVSLISKNISEDYTLEKLKSIKGDIITIKYFSNKTLQIQGRPLYLYQEATCFLAEFYSIDKMVATQSEFFKVDITTQEVQEELVALLPNSSEFLGERLKSVLSTCFVFRQIDVQLTDYTSFVFPAFRTLEGYIKSLFATKGIRIERYSTYDRFFFSDGMRYNVRPEHSIHIKCDATVAALERSYNYFNEYRNGLFHADYIDANIILVETKQKADRIVNNVLNIIEESYSAIPISATV